MDKKFKQMKKSSIRNHYQNLTEKFKTSNPKKYFRVMKEICNPNHQNIDFLPEVLQNSTPIERAEKIANHFSMISQSYEPVNLSKLPSFLPAQPPPQLSEYDIYQKIKKLKVSQSSHPIDLPSKLRKEYDIFLTLPLKDILKHMSQ